MVAFGKLITSAVALAIPALAALTPAQIVSNIEMITQKSMALQAPANTITLVNAPLLLIGQGPLPKIIAGFSDIVSELAAKFNCEGTVSGSPAPSRCAHADTCVLTTAFCSALCGKGATDMLTVRLGDGLLPQCGWG